MFYIKNMKAFLILILVLVLTVIILIGIIKYKSKKLKDTENQLDILTKQIKYKENEISLIRREVEIEKKHNKDLQKKLDEISVADIDDVIHQLQNNSN